VAKIALVFWAMGVAVLAVALPPRQRPHLVELPPQADTLHAHRHVPHGHKTATHPKSWGELKRAFK
jgi:hypothetical protein